MLQGHVTLFGRFVGPIVRRFLENGKPRVELESIHADERSFRRPVFHH